MRLTKEIKAAILDAALVKAGIPAKQQVIRVQYAEWAEAVRVRSITPAEEVEMDRICAEAKVITRKNPNFRVSDEAQSRIYLNVAGQSRKIFFNGNADADDSTKSVFKRVAYHQQPLTGDDPMAEKLFAIDHAAVLLSAEIAQLKASVNAVLGSVTTDKKLIEIWPESAAFIPSPKDAGKQNLPALPIAELNKLIGLP